jgi:hypothetical protein
VLVTAAVGRAGTRHTAHLKAVGLCETSLVPGNSVHTSKVNRIRIEVIDRGGL